MELFNYFPLVLFQIFLTVIMILMINSLGSVNRGYVTIDQLLSTTNLGYNIFYRILSPTIFISFATLMLYKIGVPNLTKDIWLIPVYFLAINLITLVLMQRFALVNKILYALIHILSIGIAFWVYESALKYGPSAILPDAGNFRTEWWFIVLGYFYSLLNNFNPNYSAEAQRKRNYVATRFKNLGKRYGSLLRNEFKKNDFLKCMFYSIMITEDINRPPFIRLVERILFPLGVIKTTGVMQVSSRKLLTDQQSIQKAQEIILKSYKKHHTVVRDEPELVNKIANDYNSGGYGANISQYYWELKSILGI